MEGINYSANSSGLLAVWGCGYIGFSDLVFFGRAGQRCIGVDVDPTIRQRVLSRSYKRDLDQWLQMDYLDLFEDGTIDIITDYHQLEAMDIAAHLVCIPTERIGEPDMSIMEQVADRIIQLESRRNSTVTAIVLESTMVPGTAAKIHERILAGLKEKTLLFAVAPRRDWFLSSEQNLANLPRILGADSPRALAYFQQVLGQVCKTIIPASSYAAAEITKCVENAFRHMDITLANQLSDAFPDLDVREVLRLVGTKWNVNTYFPSFGTGGYCIPLSSKYLLQGAQEVAGTSIPLLEETIRFDSGRAQILGNEILPNMDDGLIGVFGVAYKADTSVTKNAPALDIISRLRQRGFRIFVTDPEIEQERLMKETGCPTFDPDDNVLLSQFDAVVYCTAHSAFGSLNTRIAPWLKVGCHIYDGTDVPQSGWPKEYYHLIGTPSWRSKRR